MAGRDVPVVEGPVHGRRAAGVQQRGRRDRHAQRHALARANRGGQTKNAYVLDRNPCGSSSGTGTAIAASLAAIGVGTETDGSIICPASVSGLVGMKPTVGVVSRRGIIPISVSQDTAGPMGRSVADIALLMNALAAVDERDPAGAAAKGKIPGDYLAFLDIDALRGKRFGVLRQAMGSHPAVDAAMNAAIETMKAQGADIFDVKFARYNAWENSELDVMLYEFKDGLNAYLKASGSPIAGSFDTIDVKDIGGPTKISNGNGAVNVADVHNVATLGNGKG